MIKYLQKKMWNNREPFDILILDIKQKITPQVPHNVFRKSWNNIALQTQDRVIRIVSNRTDVATACGFLPFFRLIYKLPNH